MRNYACAAVCALFVLGGNQVAGATADSPPPPDAVWDTRYACLYGDLEGELLEPDARLAECDKLGRLESEALDLGFCWNQMKAEYLKCD